MVQYQNLTNIQCIVLLNRGRLERTSHGHCSSPTTGPNYPRFQNLHRRLIEYGVSKAVCFESKMPRALNGNFCLLPIHNGIYMLTV